MMIPMIIEASSQLGNLRPPPPPLPLELALLVIPPDEPVPVTVPEPVLELETPPLLEVLTPESELDDEQEASNKPACVEHELGKFSVQT